MRYACSAGGAAAIFLNACASAIPSAGGEVTPVVHSSEQIARNEVQMRLELRRAERPARNVIVFIGDGMGLPLITASRIFEGQQRGEEGEENYLAFERLPYSALVKTYAADAQIPDSAATASAIMTGVKARNNSLGVYPGAGENDCAANVKTPANLAETAALFKKSVGLITTSHVADATPAAVYGHAPSRRWVLPQYVPEAAAANGCRDLPAQLADAPVSVVLGGGRAIFLPTDAADPESGAGAREDGRNLVDAWKGRDAAHYVWNAGQLSAVDAAHTDNLLGLFSRGAMFDEASANPANPSLAEMTEAAIKILSRDESGFVLVVEHEGTDEHQHAGHVRRAMESAIELDDAVETALRLVDLEETLVIVTADHGQPLAFGGFAPKGNPILGLARDGDNLHLAEDGKPYTTLGFYTGPRAPAGERPDLTEVDTASSEFVPPSAVPTPAVYHSGVDVTLYAGGPWAHLFTGVMDQQTIHALIVHAMTH